MPFAATCMDLETVIPRDWSESDKDKYITYMWNLKNSEQMNLLIKQK